jgi:hypothetical protein
VPVMAVCWALAWLLKEVPLRDTSALQRSEPEVASSSVH